jgi:hypothetical protein
MTRVRSAGELAVDLRKAEEELLNAHHVNSVARSRLPRLIHAGDQAKIAECKASIASTARTIVELTEKAEFLREAVKAAEQSAVQDCNLRSFEAIRKAVSEPVKTAAKIDNLITSLAQAIDELIAGKADADSALSHAGISPLRDLLTAAIVKNTVDMKLYVETGGEFGKAVTIDSLHQLRESGRANLNKAASDYQQLTLRHARIMLKVDESEAA